MRRMLNAALISCSFSILSPGVAQAKKPTNEQLAEEPAGEVKPCRVTRGCFQFAATAGYGFDLQPSDRDYTVRHGGQLKGGNPYGPSIGGNFGYTFAFGLHTGLEYQVSLGTLGSVTFEEDESATRSYFGINLPQEGGSIEVDTTLHLIGAEVGYDFLLGPMFLRPSLHHGIAVIQESYRLNGQTISSGLAMSYAAPGLAIGTAFGPVYFGGQARAAMVFDETELFPAAMLTAHLGFRSSP